VLVPKLHILQITQNGYVALQIFTSILFLDKGNISGLCSRTPSIFCKILSTQADKIDLRVHKRLKELKANSIIASPSILGKDIQGDDLQCLARQTDSFPCILTL